MGKICRKLAKLLIKEYGKDKVNKEEIKVSLKKEELKCQILENLKIIITRAREHI